LRTEQDVSEASRHVLCLYLYTFKRAHVKLNKFYAFFGSLQCILYVYVLGPCNAFFMYMC
jgi:hypothetical protein